MQIPAPVKRHPNASFVLGTTPLTGLVVWAGLQLGFALPQWAAAMIGTMISSGLLVFRTALGRAASTVWEIGVRGVCRRVWRGKEHGRRD